jgi:hypothetical protein
VVFVPVLADLPAHMYSGRVYLSWSVYPRHNEQPR